MPRQRRRSPPLPREILQRLDWKVIRRLDGVLQGDYRSLFRGNGIDLVDLREYQPGDDVRAIDWNVTARMDTPYVREYVEDREITAWFLLDLSPSVDFGTRGHGARQADGPDRLRGDARAAADPARQPRRRDVLRQHGRADHPGARRARPGSPPDRRPALAPAPGERAVHRPRRRYSTPASATIKRRSLVFIVSDFISVPGWERPLSLLNRRHEVVAVRLLDPREIELPDVGPLIMEDAETGEQLYVDTHDAAFRRRFQDAARRREAEVNGAFRRAGVEALSLSTDEDLVRAIVRMATIRRRRRR